MKLRILISAAALAVMFWGGRHVAAQMSPMAMGYQPMMGQAGYPAPYMPMVPPQFDVRQAAAMQQPAVAADCGPCQEAICPDACSPCGICGHTVSVWGEYLYLRARNAEVAYGVPINGAIIPAPVNPIQIAPVGMTDPDFSSGFRFGFGIAMDEYSSISAQYSWYEETTSNMIQTSAPNVIRSLVSHPGTFNAARDFLSAEARQRLSFDWIDVDYRQVVSSSANRSLTVLAGTRLGQFSQDFGADYYYSGTESVDTEIDFYGAGIRLGLEGEAFNASHRWLCYGKTSASFVAGSFTADYDLVDSFDPEVVDTTWKAGRIVPMLDLELGVGWQSRCGTWRVTGGYLVSGWFNAVTTDQWVKAVQSNNFVGLSDSISFDGLVLRCEGRF